MNGNHHRRNSSSRSGYNFGERPRGNGHSQRGREYARRQRDSDGHTWEDQQRHKKNRDRSRSPIQGNKIHKSSYDSKRQDHYDKDTGKVDHCHEHHHSIQNADKYSAFQFWDDEHLKYLAGKTNPDIVKILFDDQKAFFGMLCKENVLKNGRKLKLLVQILFNLISVDETSEHMVSLLSQITSNKCCGFYTELTMLIKKMPGEQAIKKRDENFETLNWIVRVFHRLLNVLPQRCVILPLNDLQATCKQLQLINVRYSDCVTSANELVETFRAFEAARVNSSTLCDYRTIPVLPEVHEINRRAKPTLQANIIEGSYQNWNHYLHVQFSLLREDFISPLRQGICDHRRGFEDRSRHSVRVYKHVHILEPVCLYTGVGFQIQFDASYGYLRRVDWEHSRRLSFGSLLCLSFDQFATALFATVVSRDPQLLKNGILKVQFENVEISKILDINPQMEFTMVESTAYFEAYRHILNRLQNIEENPPSFRAYIVDCNVLDTIQCPVYLTVKGTGGDEEANIFDFSALGCSNPVNVLDPCSWPHLDDVSLDKSQLAAVQMALTQEVSVIQGPPGTGKTYIGLKIAEILLRNKAKWDPFLQSPILVVCYTNHALDQFLEGILRFSTEHGNDPVNMVRIGGRSRNEAIQPYNLQVLIRQHKENRCHETNYERNQLNKAKSIMNSKNAAISNDLHKVSNSTEEKPVIHELEDIGSVINYKHVRQLKQDCDGAELGKEIESWLFSVSEQTMVHDKKAAPVDRLPKDIPMEVVTDSDHADALISEMDTEAALLENDRIIDGEVFELEPVVFEKGPTKHKTHSHFSVDQIKEGMQTTAMSERAAQNIQDITQLNYTERWSLYQYWVNQYLYKCKQKVACHVETYAAACEEYQKARTELDYAVMRNTHVVGMTTTGAAKYHSILQKLRPKIVIIEEAAEVLESHIVTTLTASTQQVIMIGDHQQLRPKPNDYHLATDCNLEVSLFERLIKNQFPYKTLEVQHRMRPEIAQLICPHIYLDIVNAPEVQDYEKIDGLKHSVFFVDHTKPEDDGSIDLMSHSNEFEANFAFQLCYYLIMQGYRQHQITILTMYSGQILKIKKLLSKQIFSAVRISSVDNFQGEENDIIILSLVRSNKEGRVGFLKEPNRLCVALSRAKMGLFVIGNFTLLKKEGGREWLKIIEDMEKKELVGSALSLYCSVHDKTTSVSSGLDIITKSPQGGCSEICGFRLSCGHSCPRVCHLNDKDHQSYNCQKKCNKTLSCSHNCSFKCSQCQRNAYGCLPCQVKITKELPCGHIGIDECSRNSYNCIKSCAKILACGHKCKELCSWPCTAKCKELVIKQLPCGHRTKCRLPCWKSLSTIKCDVPCKQLLSCGHKCSGDCSTCCRGRFHKQCNSQCGRNLPCGHLCKFPCTNECPPCTEPCHNRCGHSKCASKCGDPCVPCMEDCQWKCEHIKCNKKCSEVCVRRRCNEACKKRLKCGHPCIGLCGEKCLCKICLSKLQPVTEIFFGTEDDPNARFIQLKDCGHIFEVSGLDQWMDQNDSSADSKAVEIQFKCCPKCKTSIRKSLRYGKITKQTLQDVEKVKKKVLGGSDAIINELLMQLNKSLPELRRKLNVKPWCRDSNPWCRNFLKFVNSIENKIERSAKGLYNTAITIHEVNAIQFQFKNFPKLIKLFDVACDLKKEFEFDGTNFHRADVVNDMCELWNFMMKDYLSAQNKSDFENEYNRLSVLVNLFKLCEAFLCLNPIAIDKVDLQLLNDMAIQLSSAGCGSNSKITTKAANGCFSNFDKLKTKYGIGCTTEQERIEIVKAVGLSKGHWFKCPNGHFYCIGECGGAMQKAKCPECKADIGGTRHRLTEGNVHAGEIDGSRHAAWSDTANLENYDPADIMDVD